MTISLTKPAEGTTGWAAAINQNWTDLEDALNQGTGYPKRYIEGLLLEYASATTLTLSPGSCRNGANTNNLTLAARRTANVATGHGTDGLPQIDGLDEKGLDNLSSGAITCSQTANTITASASITAHLGTRSLSGTFSTSGTAVTGDANARFLDEVSVGDLVGTSNTYGWAQVSAVNSDTSLTLAVGLPGGDAPSSTSGTVIHNPTIQPAAGAQDRIGWLSAAGTAIAVATSASHSAGSALTIGVEVPDMWLAVWVVNDGSTTGTLLSTQHETLLSETGGTTKFASARRVGWIRNGSGDFVPTYYGDQVGTRLAEIEVTPGGSGSQVLGGGTQTSWTAVLCNGVCPRTSRRVTAVVKGGASSSNTVYYFRARGRGPSTTSRSLFAYHQLVSASEVDHIGLQLPMDGAQVFDYVCSNAGGNVHVFVYAWDDRL